MGSTLVSRPVSRVRRSISRALLVALLLAGTAAAQETPPAAAPSPAPPSPAPRPRVGLVLSGGGARGAAHLGVLKVLEELHVPVDFVVGTSMGAIVGGLWASGLTAAEIEQWVAGIDWAEAFTDKPPRAMLAFRRRQDDDGLFMKPRIGLQNGKTTLPLGLIQGQRLGPLLRAMTLHVATVDDFDLLPVPFRAVATDIVSGEEVVIGNGDLVSALRASMAVPGVFAPVTRGDRLLIDGGVANNLPVDVARAAGAEIIVAVDVSARPVTRQELGSAVGIGDQMLTILMRQSTNRQLASLGARDVALEPELGELRSTDFAEAARAIALGEAGARAHLDALAPLAVSPAAWTTWSARKAQRSTSPPELEEIRLTHDTRLATALLSRRMTVRPGKLFDRAQVERDLERLYGLDLFEKVGYELLPGEHHGVVLDIVAQRKSWGTSYLRFGLGLADDLQGDTAWSLGLRLNVLELSRLGAEWRTDLRFGEDQLLRSELYLPVSLGRFFFAPRLEVRREDVPISAQGDVAALFRRTSYSGALDVGQEIGEWGEARLGIERESGDLQSRVVSTQRIEEEFDDTRLYLRLLADTFDSVAFPRRGARGFLELSRSLTGLGADTDAEVASGSLMLAGSHGRHTLYGGLAGGSTLSSGPPPELFSLGGFLNLSGTVPESLYGRHFALARLVYYRQTGGKLSRIFSLPLYLGASLEAGNVWLDRDQAGVDDLVTAGSLFVGLDTFLGPIYFAYGRTDEGEDRWYFALGAPF